MPERARTLLVLHADPTLRLELSRLERAGISVLPASSWGGLRLAAGSTPATSVVLLDPYFGVAEGMPLACELPAFRRDFAYLPVIAAMTTLACRFRDLRTLGEWGIDEVISLEQEKLREVLPERLRAAGRPSFRALLDRELPPLASEGARPVVLAAAGLVAAGTATVPHLARALCMSGRTLSRRCQEVKLPPPRRLLAWMRVLLAVRLLDGEAGKQAQVAFCCGYSSPNALRTALVELMGVGPKGVCGADAFARALRLFAAELEVH